MTDLAGRVPPHDLDAEATVLSAVLLSTDYWLETCTILRAEHFYSEAHRHVWTAVADLHERAKPVDLVTVAGWLKERSLLDAVGGARWLHDLVDATPAIAHAEEHARRLRDKWRLRQVILVCQRTAAEGLGDTPDAQGFIARHEQEVFALAHQETATGGLVPVSQEVREVQRNILAAQAAGGVTGLTTGLVDVDKRITGLHRGNLYIVAGRPGMGKTSFVLQALTRCAQKERVAPAFFSLEMPREQLIRRQLSCEGKIAGDRVAGGLLSASDLGKLDGAVRALSNIPVTIDDTPGVTLMHVRAQLRRLAARVERGDFPAERLGPVAVDYLQLMRSPDYSGNREQEISAISRGLKELAKEFQVPVVALSQLNRSVETRSTKDKRPQLSDLRESGAIEQDADAVLFLYRDDYYFEDSEDRGKAEVIVAKQRNGATGKVMVKFIPEFTRFDDFVEDYGVDYDFDEHDGFAESSTMGFQ